LVATIQLPTKKITVVKSLNSKGLDLNEMPSHREMELGLRTQIALSTGKKKSGFLFIEKPTTKVNVPIVKATSIN
jgi:hypothetical protein